MNRMCPHKVTEWIDDSLSLCSHCDAVFAVAKPHQYRGPRVGKVQEAYFKTGQAA